MGSNTFIWIVIRMKNLMMNEMVKTLKLVKLQNLNLMLVTCHKGENKHLEDMWVVKYFLIVNLSMKETSYIFFSLLVYAEPIIHLTEMEIKVWKEAMRE